MKLSVDKQSKMPLYLQLRDSVKYYISTGGTCLAGRSG